MSDDLCSICLEPFEDGRAVVKTACAHRFHMECAMTWTGANPHGSCPTCRRRDAFDLPQGPEGDDSEMNQRLDSSDLERLFSLHMKSVKLLKREYTRVGLLHHLTSLLSIAMYLLLWLLSSGRLVVKGAMVWAPISAGMAHVVMLIVVLVPVFYPAISLRTLRTLTAAFVGLSVLACVCVPVMQ